MEIDFEKIVKIIVIVAVVFSALSLIMPWGEITISGVGGGFFYSYGMNLPPSIFQNDPNQWQFYISALANDSIFKVQEANQFIIPFLSASLVVFFTLFAFFIGLGELYTISKNQSSVSSYAGLIAIISAIAFFIFIQYGLMSVIGLFSQYFEYSIGFYFIIISGILFFSAYIIRREFTDIETDDLEEIEDEPKNILKMRYAKGEITKKEFEDMKKDLED